MSEFKVFKVGVNMVDSIWGVPLALREGGTKEPHFKLISGTCYFGKGGAYISLDKIRKIERQMNITIPCPEGYEFDGIRVILKDEHYLSEADYKTVNTWRWYDNSNYPYISLKKKHPDTIKFEFERVAGLTIQHGQYYTDKKHVFPVLWDHDISCIFKDDSGVVIWRLKDDNLR